MKENKWQDWALLCGLLFLVIAWLAGCNREGHLTVLPPLPKNYPVVMVFTAKWCPNCPHEVELQELGEEFPGVMILPVDIDENPVLAAKYRVRSVPRFFLCDDEMCRTTTSLAELREWLNETR